MNSSNEQTSVNSSFKIAIPPAARKALVEFWGSDQIIDQPEIIVDLGSESICRINKIGRKSLYEIAKALDSFGYIKSPGLWLAKK